jgi:hypothetical protein
MVTLTYWGDGLWQGKHISDYLRRVRQHAAAEGYALRYQWVMELTKRGRPHYHILWWGPVGYQFPKADVAGHWRFGFTRTEAARKPVGYLVKYASKGGDSCELGAIPRGARLCGTGGCSGHERHATHRAGLPMWLDASLQPGARARRVPRVGWVCCLTGEVFASPFKVAWERDSWGIVVVIITRV